MYMISTIAWVEGAGVVRLHGAPAGGARPQLVFRGRGGHEWRG